MHDRTATHQQNDPGTPAVPPGRRLVAAGVISRKVDVRITEAGVTGAIRKGARR
ncbi:hypothetical protein ABTX35_39070 [Streptomyces sp. NPDC096080]|uniref:hypothetical protein n=1 Tax=Streptomyces sp. NPDC096080 TaxID=3156693 RepID=UPI00332306A3